MTNDEKKAFIQDGLVLLNDGGTKFSEINNRLGKAIERLDCRDIPSAQKEVSAADKLNSYIGDGPWAKMAAKWKVVESLLIPPAAEPAPPVVPPPVINPPPVVAPPAPPAPEPVDPRLDYPEPTQVYPSSILWGQSLRDYMAQMRYINALKFVAQKTGLVTLHLAEFRSPPTTYQCALSKTAGDLAGANEGNQPQASILVTAGETYFFNFRAWSRDIGRTATFEVQSVVVEGSWPG